MAGALFITQDAPAATVYWAGTNGVSVDTNWSDSANFVNNFPAGTPLTPFNNEAQFTYNTAAQAPGVITVNVDGPYAGEPTPQAWDMSFVHTNGYHTVLIQPGQTLQIQAFNGTPGNGFYVAPANFNASASGGGNTVGSGPYTNNVVFWGTNAAFTVNGTMRVDGAANAVENHYTILDMSGVDYFSQFSSSAGSARFQVVNGSTRGQALVYLAKTNLINNFSDVTIGYLGTSSNSLPIGLYLGISNSIITGPNGNGNQLSLAIQGVTNGFLKFNPAFLGGPNKPVVNISGNGAAAGNGGFPTVSGMMAGALIGRSDSGLVPTYGIADFTGGIVTWNVGQLQLGRSGTNTIAATGVLAFDSGTVTANDVWCGWQQTNAAAATGAAPGVGIINVGANATLQVANTIRLGLVNGTAVAGTAGTISLNGGVLSAGAITNGGGVATIQSSNATVTLATIAGTLAFPINNLTLTNTTLNLAVQPAMTNVVAQNVTTAVGNTINITAVPPQPGTWVKEQITLIKYLTSLGGAGYNFSLGSLPAFCAGFLSNNVANSSVDLVLTSGPVLDTWSGTTSGDWDTTTANWNAGTVMYVDGSYVAFPDGASTGTINLTGTFMPAGVTVSNSALTYTFGGSGAIAGSTALTKTSTGTLIIDNSGNNTFSGGVNLASGILQVGNNDSSGNLPSGAVADAGVLAFDRVDNITVANNISGSGAVVQAGNGGQLTLSGANTFTGPVVATNNSILQLGSSTAAGVGSSNVTIVSGSTLDADGHACIRPLVVSGAGAGGNGALVNSGGPIYDSGVGLATNITLAGDTTFTIANRMDFGAPASGDVLSTGGHAYNLTLNASTYFEWSYLTVDANLASINLLGGTLGIVGTTTFGNSASNLVISSTATMDFWGPRVFVNKAVDFQNGTINNERGTNIMNGAMTLESGYCVFSTANGTSLILSNALSGTGVLYDTGGGASGTLVLAGNSPGFAGGVQLYLGSVVLNGTIGCGITNQPETTITGNGTANGSLDVSGNLVPGSPGVAGTLTVGGDLVLESSANVTNNLVTTTMIGGGVNSLIQVTGNVAANGNTLYVNPLAPLLNGATYTLITYTGTLSGSLAGAVTVPPYVLTLTNITTTSPKKIAVIVSGGSSSILAWNNASGNGEWDVAGSANWTNLTTSVAPDYFYSFDPVLLLDSITNSPTPTTSIDIAAGQIVVPTVLTNNSSTNYTISGAGKISGLASIVKQGSSTLTIATTNDFTGSVTIQGGTLKAGVTSSLGGASGTVFVTNAATLDLIYSLAGKPLVISGAGVGGLGALVNNDPSGTPIYDNPGGVLNVALAGNATIGGTNRMDFGQISPGSGVLSSGGSNYSLTVVGTTYREWDNVAFDTNFGNINIMTTGGGTVGIKGTTTLGNPTNTLSVFSNANVTLYQDSASGAAVTINKKVLLYGGSTLQNGGSTNVIISPVVLGLTAGDACTNNIGGTSLTVSNVISGPGSLVKSGSSPLYLAAANTFTGNTVVSGGALALIGTGSIATSPTIALTAGTTVDVSGRIDQTLTLAGGQVLQGGGTVNGSLTASGGSTISPGTSAGTGILSVTTNSTLNGNALFKLNGSTNDVLASGGMLTYGGTLTLTNISGSPLGISSIFKLFNAGSYSGGFSSIITEPPLAAGLAWNTNNLTVNGTISVVSAIKSKPVFTGISLSGTTLTITATNGTALGSFVLLGSTNLSSPTWTPLLTNSFNGSGNINLSTNIINPGVPDEFFMLSQ